MNFIKKEAISMFGLLKDFFIKEEPEVTLFNPTTGEHQRMLRKELIAVIEKEKAISALPHKYEITTNGHDFKIQYGYWQDEKWHVKYTYCEKDEYGIDIYIIKTLSEAKEKMEILRISQLPYIPIKKPIADK